jgi:pyrroline-5-carboxylate reductase
MATIGFLGGGRVTRILVGGWRHAGLMLEPLVHEPDAAAFGRLADTAPAVRRASLAEAAATDIVFLALHPPAIRSVLPALPGVLGREALLVSLAPKVPLAALAAEAGTSRVARMIPNAPSIVGQGYNPVTFGPGLDARERATLTELFAPWGSAPEVNETQLEAYAILTGMGPTYYWFQWQALRDIAGELGLPQAETDVALRAMLAGAMVTLLDSGLSPSAVMDLIPVKPMEAAEPSIVAAYRATLPALHAKIRPETARPT